MRRVLLICALLTFDTIVVAQSPTDTAQNTTNDKQESPTRQFLKLDNPPIRLGHAGDRVRELQATLNKRLVAKAKNRIIHLDTTIEIGEAFPWSDTDDKLDLRVRVVDVENLEYRLQVRGDWRPLDENGRIKWNPTERNEGELKKAQRLELPDKPLKVDGVYGQRTYAAVALFQMLEHLPITGDVDAVTLDELEPMVPTNPMLATIMNWVSGPLDKTRDAYPRHAKTKTALYMTLVILIASLVVYQIARILANSTRFLSRWLFTPSTSPWFTALREKQVFTRMAQFAPAVFIYCAARVVFPEPALSEVDGETIEQLFPYLDVFQDWHVIVSRLGLAYASLVFMLVSFAFVDACDAIYSPDHDAENPISGIIRAGKRFVGIIGAILLISALVGENPWRIVGGLGAFMAVIMLVFRDYLLGVAASFQIISNKMVKIGDWIEMPKHNADGDVKEISLNVVKVQNFDKTISTIPTHSLLSESFRNWSGMQAAGGRRIKRAIFIDMNSIRVCTPEMVDQFSKIELISEYVIRKRKELDEYNLAHAVAASPANQRRLTNIGTFRAYLEAYLDQHSGLSDKMTYLVRHLQPTSNGMPIEIYAYCIETAWAKYEGVQADIFDHVLAILPEFGLRAFQEISDIRETSKADTRPPEWQSTHAEARKCLEEQNRTLENRPNARVNTAIRRVKEKLKQLGMSDDISVEASNRTLSLVWRAASGD